MDFSNLCEDSNTFLHDFWTNEIEITKNEEYRLIESKNFPDFFIKSSESDYAFSTKENSYQHYDQQISTFNQSTNNIPCIDDPTCSKENTISLKNKFNLIFKKKGFSERNHKPDSMRKKFKIAMLVFFINKFNEKGRELGVFKKAERLRKLHKSITSNINISFNQQMIGKSMNQLYLEDDICDGRAHDFNRFTSNKKLLKKLEKENWAPLRLMMKQSVYDVIIEYIHSESFKDHLLVILKDFGNEYYKVYKTYAFDYLSYFSKSKANLRKFLKNQMKEKN
jgi:hypothetical protein